MQHRTQVTLNGTSEHNMAVSIATYGDRGWFVDNHNVLVDMYEGDRLAGHRYFVPATIHTSGRRLLATDSELGCV